MKRLFSILAVLLVLLDVLAGASPAQAQTAPDVTVEQVRERYREAVAAYRDGDYEAAALAYLDLYRMSPDPVLLYNAAYAFGRAERFGRAIEEGRRARRQGLEDPAIAARNEARLAAWSARETADVRVEVLEALGPAATAPAPTDSASGIHWGLWTSGALTALGGSSLVGAVVVSRNLQADSRELESAADQKDREAYDSTLRGIERRQRLGRILLVGGSVLAIGGGSWLVYELADGGEVALSVDGRGVRARVLF